MGMRIGDIGGSVPAPPPESRSLSKAAVTSYPLARSGMENPSGNSETLKAGFGDNTISPPGIVLQTIGKNFRGVRQLVQNVERLRAESRAQREAQASAREEQIRRAAEVAERLNEVRRAITTENTRVDGNSRQEQLLRPETAPEANQFSGTNPETVSRISQETSFSDNPVAPTRLDLLI